jgi:hypothetical protein
MKSWHRLIALTAVAILVLIIAYPPARAAVNAAVSGTYQNSGNTGYLGTANSGVEGYVTSSAGDGVYGNSAASYPGSGVHGISGTNYGVYGQSSSQSFSSGGGVVGICSICSGVAGLSTTGNGVFGSSQGTGNASIGIVGTTADNGGGSGLAMYGQAPTGGTAGYFQGNVHIIGTLFKSAGAFQIDHPLDPANKYLSHSFVESDEMKNVYDGVVTLGKSGEAVVELPNWFEALNKDFRYQLTCIGEHAPVYIAEKVHDNQFRIAGGYAGMEVSWQVTGNRHDPYAVAHPIVVEQLKRPEDKGKLLHPALYKMPDEMTIGYDRIQQLDRLTKALSARQPR